MFDLASLTKILSTTLITAHAVELGRLSLEEKPFSQWPNVTVRNLLQHTSGLPGWQNLYAQGIQRRLVYENALALPALSPPKMQTIYSDLGFIALGNLLESRFGDRLDILFDKVAARCFPSSRLQYLPCHTGARTHADIAPTGYCPTRKRPLIGEVNDLNAYAMEGVAPHAGLFGTFDDVVIAAEYFIATLRDKKDPLDQIVRTFLCATGDRALGFDKTSRHGSTDGALSAQSVGHLGFTGTSLWIDPLAANGRGAYFVLLTNHLQSSSRKSEIAAYRKTFHRAAVRWLTSNI